MYGCSQFRHHILGELVNVGGNFAYAIRPSERGKGYGTIQLKLLNDKIIVVSKKRHISAEEGLEELDDL